MVFPTFFLITQLKHVFLCIYGFLISRRDESFNITRRAFLFRLLFNNIIWAFFTLQAPEYAIKLWCTFVKFDRTFANIRNYFFNLCLRVYFWEWNTPQRFQVNGTEVYKVCGNKTDVDSKVVILYGHGGAYFGETTDAEFPQISLMSSDLGIPIYLVRYRLLPENSFDDSLEDMIKVYEYLANHEFRVILHGVSAGGHLMIRLVQEIEKRYVKTIRNGLITLTLPAPVGIMMYSPMFDFSFSFHPELEEAMKPTVMSIYNNHKDLNLQAIDCSSFPPIWMQNDTDANLDYPAANKNFVTNALVAGVDIEHIQTKGLWHAITLAYGFNIEECESVFERNREWVQMIIARSSVDSEYDSSGECGFKGGEESGTDSSYSRGPHAWPNSRAKWNRPDRRRQAKLRVKFAEGTLSEHSKSGWSRLPSAVSPVYLQQPVSQIRTSKSSIPPKNSKSSQALKAERDRKGSKESHKSFRVQV